MADIILKGSGGGGSSSDEATVTAPYVLRNKKYVGSDTNDEIGTGTMPDIGQFTHPSALKAEESINIPRGYHDGTGVITSESLANQTFGTATAADIWSGKTAWVNGSLITGVGTVTNVSSLTKTADGYTTIGLSWKNPSNGFYSGVKIHISFSGYPADDPNNESGLAVGAIRTTGSNTAFGGTSAYTVSYSAGGPATVYVRIFPYAIVGGSYVYGTSHPTTAGTRYCTSNCSCNGQCCQGNCSSQCSCNSCQGAYVCGSK